MAIFKIIKSKTILDNGKKVRESKFEYKLLQGELKSGDVFRLYETHHYTDFIITNITKIYFVASPNLFISGWGEKAVLDTENLESGRKFGYGGSGQKLYHPEVLRKLGCQ